MGIYFSWHGFALQRSSDQVQDCNSACLMTWTSNNKLLGGRCYLQSFVTENCFLDTILCWLSMFVVVVVVDALAIFWGEATNWHLIAWSCRQSSVYSMMIVFVCRWKLWNVWTSCVTRETAEHPQLRVLTRAKPIKHMIYVDRDEELFSNIKRIHKDVNEKWFLKTLKVEADIKQKQKCFLAQK